MKSFLSILAAIAVAGFVMGQPTPVSPTASATLDGLGTTRGSVIYRGANGWVILTPGTVNYALVSGGAGANPSYAAVVNSLSGTANQIAVSSATGTPVLSIAGPLIIPDYINSQSYFVVNKAGTDSVGSGPNIRIANANNTRIWMDQLNASNGIDTWYYNGTVWTKLVTWSTAGIIATYKGIATVSNGVPAEYGTADLTDQSAEVSATTIYTPAADGMFRISAAMKITTTGTSPVAGPITITYTDADGSVAQSQVMMLQSVTGSAVTTTVNNSTTTGTVNGSMIIYAKAGVAIQYAIAVSGTFGSGRFSAHLKLEAL